MTVVETHDGKLRGAEIADGILAWRGIPYAWPPVDELRLRPPEPPARWYGVRDALAYGNRSLQPDPGLASVTAAQDWLRSSGKPQLAVASAESLWQSGEVDLLVWIDATSRASVLAGYAAATAEATESTPISTNTWLMRV